MATPTIENKEIVIVVEPTRSGRQVKHHCPYCGTKHVYGHPDDRDPGYRVSHCIDERSPHFGKGVRLVLGEGTR